MGIVIRTSLNSVRPDTALRVGDFSLLPSNFVLPTIKSNPTSNLYQKTWIKSVENGTINYQKVRPDGNTILAVEGTKIGWSLFATNPSNTNPNSDEGLSFYWRKDGTPMVELNLLNQGRGSKSVFYSDTECTVDKTGQYICEVSNQVGTVETTPLNLQVINLDTYPKLFSNLILNGDAEAQGDGWTADSDIISVNFAKDWICLNGQSLPNLPYLFDTEQQKELLTSFEFAFNQNGIQSTYKLFRPWMQTGPNWRALIPSWMSEKPNPYVISPTTPLDGWAQWALAATTPQIINNEDGADESQFGAFFPSMKYIDSYNRNTQASVVGLYRESNDRRLSYFTRDKITLARYGGKSTSQMSQTVDLSDLSNFIDGNVLGVSHTTSQFFAYIGAGITRYKIRAQIAENARDRFTDLMNWYVVDYENFLARIKTNADGVKKSLLPNTPIDIIPIADDITSVELQYLDGDENVLTTDTIKGPDARDVFAIKDRTFFPLTLYPLFEFFIQNNNPVRVFGQTYTTTEALAPLFEEETPYPLGYREFTNGPGPVSRFAGWQGDAAKLERVTDSQALFGLSKINWTRWGNWPPKSDSIQPNRSGRSLFEYGSAAMFGVEKTRIIPKGARAVQITVKFEHTSETLADNNPRNKKWSEQTLYLDAFGQSSGVSIRTTDYSYPKCGITKAKFIVLPNNFKVSNKHVTYKLPPAGNTVVGYRKKQLNLDVHNSAERELFEVDTAIDRFALAAALPPTTTSPFISDNQAQYLLALQQQQNQDGQGQEIDQTDPDASSNTDEQEANNSASSNQQLTGEG